MIGIAEPTFDDVKLPALVKITFALSAEITPSNEPALTVAVVLRSYSLFVTTVPVIVMGLGVILALIEAGCVTV